MRPAYVVQADWVQLALQPTIITGIEKMLNQRNTTGKRVSETVDPSFNRDFTGITRMCFVVLKLGGENRQSPPTAKTVLSETTISSLRDSFGVRAGLRPRRVLFPSFFACFSLGSFLKGLSGAAVAGLSTGLLSAWGGGGGGKI